MYNKECRRISKQHFIIDKSLKEKVQQPSNRRYFHRLLFWASEAAQASKSYKQIICHLQFTPRNSTVTSFGIGLTFSQTFRIILSLEPRVAGTIASLIAIFSPGGNGANTECDEMGVPIKNV